MRRLTVAFFVLIATHALSVGIRTQDDSTLRYTISVQPTSDRTEILIDVEWKAEGQETVTVGLPQDYYGTGDLKRFLRSFEGVAETIVAAGKDESHRELTPGAEGTVHVRYRMSYDPKEMEDISFGPISTPKRFQTFCCQWMLQIGDLEKERPIEIAIKNLPPGWKGYSSMAPNAEKIAIRASYNDLISAMIGAGEVASHEFQVEGKPVGVYLDQDFKLKKETMLKQIEKVVRLQRDWFKDYDQPFYTISFAVRPDNVAGTCIENAFVCFLKRDVTAEQLLLLLSHEMFHNWLPLKIHVDNPGEKDRWEWEWFDEGFDDYFSRKVLLEAKLMSKGRFVELLNRDLRNIADDPARNSNYEQVKADMAAGRFSTAHKKLSYYRGAVMASNWDARIQARSKGAQSLNDLLKKLYRDASKSKGRLTQEQFFADANEAGIDAKAEQERYIVKGESIDPEPGAAGPEYELREVEMPSFDPGFAVSQSLREHKIVGLKPDGPAYRAGIREGMRLERVQNSNRFGNAWEEKSPFNAWVEVDGKVRHVRYMPHGARVKVWQYVRK